MTTPKTEAPGVGVERSARTAARYKGLMRVCRAAFEDGQYDCAYHALAAAMHCATDLGASDGLEAVEALATEQIGFIDAHAPDYHHSTRAAAGRGNPPPLATLARQASAHVLMLRRAVPTPKPPG